VCVFCVIVYAPTCPIFACKKAQFFSMHLFSFFLARTDGRQELYFRILVRGVATGLPKGCSATPQTKWAAPVNRPDPRRKSMGGGSGLRAVGERHVL